jgi:hypothetical protein
LPQSLHQQLEDRAGVPGRVAVGGAQVGDQQLVAAEDVQGQEAVVVVVAVEEPPLLVAVNRRVGGVEVQHQALGGLLERGDELLDQSLGHLEQRLAVGPALQPAQGGRGGQRPLGVGGVLGQHLPQRVTAEVLMAVEILIARGDPVDALGQQGAPGVSDQLGVARVGQGAVQGVEQAEAAVGLAQQQGPGVGGDRAGGEVGLDPARTQGGKGQGLAVTPCHSGGCLVGVLGS